MPSESTAIQARTVFRQDTAPSNTDALWIDTSETANPLKTYSEQNAAWEKVGNTEQRIQEIAFVTNQVF
jgi:hypothetical protein